MMNYMTNSDHRTSKEVFRLALAIVVIFCFLLVASQSLGDLIVFAKGFKK
jgi:hypothetical protein